MRRARIVLMLVLAGVSSTATALQARSLIPLGEGEATAIVDRYIAAANRGSLEDMAALMASGARGFDYATPAESFVAQEWLSAPFLYPLVQLNLGFPPTLSPDDELQVAVIGRMAVGSMLLQTERWQARRGGTTTSIQLDVLYKLRGGRILRMWFLPVQERWSPASFVPRYEGGNGALVAFDVAHGNAATPDGVYSRMADLLRRDGHRVEVFDEPFDEDSLGRIDVLVIANALPADHVDAPPEPGEEVGSAFGAAEIRAVVTWVNEGGRLLLVADHDPMPATAAELAREFGAELMNGSVRDVARPGGGGDIFSRTDSTLLQHPITNGDSARDRVTAVRTFLGSAMKIQAPLCPLLVLNEQMQLARPGDERDPSKWIPVGGLAQVAAGTFGQGRVALFGEAWVFRFFSEAGVDGNAQLILNLFRWFAGGAPAPVDCPEAR